MAMEQFSIVLGCVLGFWAGFFTRGGMSFSAALACHVGPHVYEIPSRFTIFNSPYIINGLLCDDPAR